MPIAGMDEHVGQVAPDFVPSVWIKNEPTLERNRPDECDWLLGTKCIEDEGAQLKNANECDEEGWIPVEKLTGVDGATVVVVVVALI